MKALTRRQLAIYAADKLLDGQSAEKLATELSGELYSTKRFKQTEMLIADVNKELEQRKKLAKCQVTTARPLSSAETKKLIKRLEQMTGALKIQLEFSIDKSVLGGIKLKTALWERDSTIKSQIDSLRDLSVSGDQDV